MVPLHSRLDILSLLIFLSPFPSLVIAEIVNRTIDDTFGDSENGFPVTYLPADIWSNQNCVSCAIKPDVASAFEGTYTAATYFPNFGSMNITMHFNGTAIYVFFILFNNEGSEITTKTLTSFTLDGNQSQLFEHIPDMTTSNVEFNQLVFSQTNLINTQHTLVVATSGVDEHIYVNFDYALYTHDDDTPLLPITEGPLVPITTLTFVNSTMVTGPVAPEVTVTTTSIASPSAFARGSLSNTKSTASIAGPIAGGTIFSIALISF